MTVAVVSLLLVAVSWGCCLVFGVCCSLCLVCCVLRVVCLLAGRSNCRWLFVVV